MSYYSEVKIKNLVQQFDSLVELEWPKTVFLANHQSLSKKKHIFVRKYPRLIIGTSGVGSFIVDSDDGARKISLQPGDALFLYPGCWTEPLNNQHYQCLEILLHSSRIEIYEDDLDSYPFHKSITSYPITKDWGPLTALFSFFSKAVSQNSGMTELELKSLSRLIVSYTSRFLKKSNFFKPEKRDKSLVLFENAHTYVREYFHQDITRTMVAEKLNISPGYVNELFKKYLGYSFKDALMTLRMEHAHDLLAERSLKIRDIAELCGFNSLDNFTFAFRQNFDMPPTVMRKKLLQGEEPKPKNIRNVCAYKRLEILSPQLISELTVVSEPDLFIKIPVYFINFSKKDIKVFQLDDKKQRIFKGEIEPGSRLRIGSDPESLWLITDKDEVELGLVRTHSEPGIAIID